MPGGDTSLPHKRNLWNSGAFQPSKGNQGSGCSGCAAYRGHLYRSNGGVLMEAASLLACLHTAGLTVTRAGDQLIVSPRDRLTDELRNAIRNAKPKLLSALTPNLGICPPAPPSLDVHARAST